MAHFGISRSKMPILTTLELITSWCGACYFKYWINSLFITITQLNTELNGEDTR